MFSQRFMQVKKILLSVGIGAGAVMLMQTEIHWPQRGMAAKPEGLPAGGKYWVEKSANERSSGSGVDAAALNKTFVNLAEATSPTVVNIYTKSKIPVRQQMRNFGSQEDMFRFFFGNPFGEQFPQPQEREAQALGSGFVIHSSGVIVTNSHVVRPTGRNADSVMVKFNTESEKSEGHPAEIVGVDETTDVAVLRLKKSVKDLKAVPLGNSDTVKVGEWVVAIGNPYGHSHSVTKGIISALGRNITEGLGGGLQRSNFIQTDASINPGNSGGPLINLYGEVIGINTAIDARAQGIGFAIPINVAKSVIGQIMEKGSVTLGYIGVGLSDLTPQIAKSLGLKDSDGAFIQEVVPGGPADRGGMQAYDVVREIAGKTITSDRDLLQVVSGSAPGTKLPMKVFREGKDLSFTVVVAARPSEKVLARGRGGPDEEEEGPDLGAESKLVGKTGLSVIDLSGEWRRRLRLGAGVKGALVHQVDPEGPAAVIGIQPGDLITEIDRKPVHNAAEARRALGVKKDAYLIKIQRASASVIVLLDVSAS